MSICKLFRSIVFASVAFSLQLAASGSTINFTFSASLDTGTLAGTHFNGTASYDSQGSSAIGTSYLTLTSLNFTLLGESFTRSDINQGGQAILQNGVLSYFTAAFFPSGPGPVDDIAFGFGGPGIIGYSVPPGFSPGTGFFTVLTNASPVPEPSTLALCVTSLSGVLLSMRTRRTNRSA